MFRLRPVVRCACDKAGCLDDVYKWLGINYIEMKKGIKKR